MNEHISRKSFLVLTVMLAILSPSAFAVDGVVLIDQNRALAGNVTPGDAAGFPVHINVPGSYRLSGNLTVPNADTHAIVIQASNVTLDLNGFAIIGPVTCTFRQTLPFGISCSPSNASGVGVFAIFSSAGANQLRQNITVYNGTVRGMNHGVFLFVSSALVEKVLAHSNNSVGIALTGLGDVLSGTGNVTNCVVTMNGGAGILVESGNATHNIVKDNDEEGIVAGEGTVSHNTSMRNRHGILAVRGTVLNNTVLDNRQNGLSALDHVGYGSNVFGGNTEGSVVGGVSMGHNVCNGTAC